MGEPGSILKMVRHYSNRTADRPLDVPSAFYDRFQRTPCAMIPRVLITAVTSPDEDVARDVPPAVNASELETLKWRYRATRRYYGIDRDIDDWGKSIVDVSRVEPEDFAEGGTAHFALRSICDRDQRLTNYSEVPVGIHHYLGSWRAFFCRDDARVGSWRHSVAKWKKRAFLGEGGPDDQVRPWIRGFVDMVGERTARFLLRGAGQLTECRQVTGNEDNSSAATTSVA